MNQTPDGLLDRLSPRPMVCPLVRLGHNSSSTDETSTSNASENNFNFRHQYSDHYGEGNLERNFASSQASVNNYFYKPPRPETQYMHTYYHHEPSYRSENLVYETPSSPLVRDNTYHKPDSRNLSPFSLKQSYWEEDVYNKVSDHIDYFSPYEKIQSQRDTNYLLEHFSTLGKTSPNLDQGYNTLIAPSPVPLSNSIWTDDNLYKGKKFLNKSNSIDRLSDDLIIKIFSFLTSIELSICARVCRRFDNLAWTPCLWRNLSIEGENISADKAIKGVLRQLCGQGRTGACPSVEKVRIGEGANLSDKSLLLLARRCPELTNLQINGCTNITNSALFEIATRCINLQHLDVTGCVKISCISINGPETSRRLQLQYIDLTDCIALQDNGLKIIVCNCPNLSYLYLRRCLQLTDGGLKFVPSFCPSLKELSVSDCVNITDFGLYELAKLGATLRYLSVAKCDQVSDAGLKVIARRCYKLRYLNARGCEAVSDDAITILARSCTRLRALDIGKCDVSDAGLRALAESCPNLKKLSLRNCDLVTDRGVQCIAYFCRGLQQLNIQDCQISLEGYRAVKKYCKRCVIEHTNPGFF